MGKHRGVRFLAPFVTPHEVVARTTDGFLMHLDSSDFIQRSIYLSGTWDDDVGRVVREVQAGGLFVDCGANVGYFSLLAASRGASVLAFEPNPRCAQLIEANARLNGFESIEIRRLGLSSEAGRSVLHVEDLGNIGGGSLKSTGHEVGAIDLDTLDNQLAGATPNLIKIDVEGAEVMVLRGAEKTLSAANAPSVLCEISEFSLRQLGSSKEELFGLMTRYGYEARIISPVRRSVASADVIYFQYDALFTKRR